MGSSYIDDWEEEQTNHRCHHEVDNYSSSMEVSDSSSHNSSGKLILLLNIPKRAARLFISSCVAPCGSFHSGKISSKQSAKKNVLL
jgi:hypothetical protein